MNAFISRWYGTLLDAVYPPVCLVCDVPVASGCSRMLCVDCEHSIITDPFESCPFCASTIGAGTDIRNGCTHCRTESFAFASATRLGPYDGKLRDAILRMKHSSGEALADALGSLWIEKSHALFQELKITFVVPVPLHWIRFFQRGYNQSESLARQFATHLEVPLLTRGLRRVRNTQYQAGQSRDARRQNLRGAFIAAKNTGFAGGNGLLVDDVLTTGATAHAAARCLLEAGAASVHVAVLARR